MICVSILLFSILINLSKSQLPQGVHRVPSCPAPNNLTAWKEASAALNCTSDLEDEDPRKLSNIYNCMPSNYLNETVAFCGKMTAISEGNCPVLNYEHRATAPTGRPCTASNFTNGCPKELFHTRETFKYPACLEINLIYRCYYANPECPRNYIRSTTMMNVTTTGLGRTTTSDSLDNNKKVPDDRGSLSTEFIVILILGSACLMLIITLVLVIFLRRKKIVACNLVFRKKGKKPQNMAEREEMEEMIDEQETSINDENTVLLDELNRSETIETSLTLSGDSIKNTSKSQTSINVSTFGEKADMETVNGMEEMKEKNIEKKETKNDVIEENIATYTSVVTKNRNVGNSPMTPSETPIDDIILDPEKEEEDRLLFNSFYLDLVYEIINRDLVQDIAILLHDTTEDNTVNQKELFMRWNKKYKFQFNLWHLQELLRKCRADDLVVKCTEFAKRCRMKLIYFECIPDEDRELLIIHTTMDKSQKSTYDQMENIRHLLASRLHLPLGEIQLCGVKEGSLIFEFSLPKENVQEIEHMDLSSIWPLKVFRIETKAWILEPDLLTTKCMLMLYVQVEQHKSRMQERLQILGLAISNEMKGMGFHIKIYEHHMKCTIGKTSCAQGRTSIEYKPHPFEKEILENMEPSIVKEFLIKYLPGYRREIEDLFSPTNARRQTAKAILVFLSGKKEKSFKNTTNCVIDMYRNKDIPTCEKEGSNDSTMAAENGLFQDTERLFEEIDSSVIDDTFEKIGDVPFDIVQKCSSGSGRKRKERAKTFYDFVNRNKEHFEIFRSILQNNCD